MSSIMDTAVLPPNDMDLKDGKPTALTPPASEESPDKHDQSSSDLSDLDLDDIDNEEITPDHYYEGGKIPVFKPTMDQFRSFKSYVAKIDKYGMKSGIVKVIPPKEWRDALPSLDEAIKAIRVKNPISQEFHGSHGIYTQANIEKQRSYTLPQWKELCEESNHQPPARRGERRRNQDRATKNLTPKPKSVPLPLPPGQKRRPGRPRVRPLPEKKKTQSETPENAVKVEEPPTPKSPAAKPTKVKKEEFSEDDVIPTPRPRGRQPKSVTARRKYNRKDASEAIDEEAFKGFDYRIHNQAEFTPERCHELEAAYWKSLTFNNPMYGADMPGSLFDDSTTSWNVAHLENLLDVLGTKVPGVNTTYLYLGMWKATFAWHLEDVDLYSINYIHFGAPKQWYSISQEDARRFETAMKSVWPSDAKSCDQFLRHKTYLISPSILQSQYNIRVNRMVHHEGEFVITYPYGYHSGFNLGYNCAESVNFATEHWLDYGKVARKCDCESDSVWVDVYDIERKLRGESTPEYYEEETDEEDDEEDEDEATELPTPPGSVKGRPPKQPNRKRKRETADKDKSGPKKRLRIRIKAPAKEPCVLCPNDNPGEELLPTDTGHKAHRRCAMYTLETYISEETTPNKVCNVAGIGKARLDLKCNYCRLRKGACFQCSQLRCTRAYHATCAAAAGVQVDVGKIPVFDEDGTEYIDIGIDFRCRFHRTKRGRHIEGAALEENPMIRKYASKLPVGEVVQMQYFQSDIFAGVVVENRKSEQTILVDVLPRGDRIEVEWKWILVFDPANSHLPVPSADAKPLPLHLLNKARTTATEDPQHDEPKPDDPFNDPNGPHFWGEFKRLPKIIRNPYQQKVDLSKSNQLWYYLGRTSTEAKAQYTEDPTKRRNNTDANFLETVRPPAPIVPPPVKRQSFPATYPMNKSNQRALNAIGVGAKQMQSAKVIKQDKPYQYKPKGPPLYVDPRALSAQRSFVNCTQFPSSNQQNFSSQLTSMSPTAPMAPMSPTTTNRPFQFSPPSLPVNRRASLGMDASSMFGSFGDKSSQLHHKHNVELYRQRGQSMSIIHPQPIGRRVSDLSVFSDSAAIPRTPHNPFFRPPPPSSGMPTVTVDNRPRTEPSPSILEKFPYLLEAKEKHARVYKSPYATGSGFSPEYLPCGHPLPGEETHSANSFAQDYLMQRSPSRQEMIKQGVYHPSDFIAPSTCPPIPDPNPTPTLTMMELLSTTVTSPSDSYINNSLFPQTSLSHFPQTHLSQVSPFRNAIALQPRYQTSEQFALEVNREAQSPTMMMMGTGNRSMQYPPKNYQTFWGNIDNLRRANGFNTGLSMGMGDNGGPHELKPGVVADAFMGGTGEGDADNDFTVGM
ncbi:MAG: hypothetical protein M1834_007039 [Cirrosporium novae-zelandiae]|nr:MAG: hypothetical protein M1834_007039 [Cirrosporium novae-zelandiae]